MTPAQKARARVLIARPNNAAMAMAACAAGYFLVHRTGAWIDFACGLIIVFCAHAAATIANDRADFEIDKLNMAQTPLHTGEISMAEARKLELGFTVAALVVSLQKPWLDLPFVAVALTLGWLYNRGPFWWSRRPWLSMLVMGLTYAAVPLIYGYCLAGGRLDWLIGAAALIWFVRRVSVSILKDYKDETGDRALGKRTFFLVYGYRLTGAVSIGLAIVAVLGMGWLAMAVRGPSFWLLPLALLGGYAVWLRRRLPGLTDSRIARKIFPAVVLAENRFELGYILWLALA